MESKIISFGGVPTPSFLIVEKVDLPPLAPSIVATKEVPMKSGKLFANQKFDSRTIPVDLALIAPTKDEYQETCAKMAEWLYSKTPQPIIFSERPNVTYYAILEGGTDFTQFRELGRGTVNFVCHKPHGYGTTQEINLDLTKESTPLINLGNMETSPIIDVTMAKNVTDFFIATSDKYCYFGEPFDPTEKQVVDLSPTIMNDNCSTTQNWLNVTDWTVDGGQIRGAAIQSNGYTFEQGATDGKRDYGTASGLWHGSSMVYSLEHEIQDFEIEVEIGFKATDKKQKGRIEIYLLDKENRKLGKLAMKDIDDKRDNPIFETRLRAPDGFTKGTEYTYGAKKGVFSNFHGHIKMGRRGRQWHTFIAKLDEMNDYVARDYKSITDTWNKFGTKVAKLQIHFGAYSNDPPVDSMWIGNIMIEEYLPKADNKVDYLFKKNDRLYINCETGEILRNGMDASNKLYIGSEPLIIPKGVSGVTVSDPSIFSGGKVRFTERWL